MKWFFAALLFAGVAFGSDKIDIEISRYFFKEQDQSFSTNGFYTFLYNHGTKPALCIGIGAAVFFILSFFLKNINSLRKDALFLSLVLALGSGLLINGILKPYWGRPRPRHIEQFGGKETFRPFYSPGSTGKSFCSGHTSMGFYFYALYRLGKRRISLFLQTSGLILMFILGGCLCLARIAQGGHFFSDAVASLFIMAAVSHCLEAIIFKKKPATI